MINETTGEEIYANKDIEYYHGYTDGENWTEGNTTEEFNICGVAAGKYHLAITPMKATEDITKSNGSNSSNLVKSFYTKCLDGLSSLWLFLLSECIISRKILKKEDGRIIN